MPRIGPPTSGYQRLAQEADLTDSDDEDDRLLAHIQPVHAGHGRPSAHRYNSSSSVPVFDRSRSASAVDIKVINARLEKWADQIANKFKFKKGRSNAEQPPLEILYSVFVPPEGYAAKPQGDNALMSEGPPDDVQISTKEQFDEVVDSVREAIRKGIDPKLIRQGSSGSYFMRDSDGKIVAVFKPKDEEPYGKLNPKMMKWLHRTLFPCFFGRACLIPNLSYISEAGACLLDRQLRTYMVPYTDIVHLSSKAFHYDYWDRRNFYRRRKPLPPKVGSFQVFLQGYQDANIFLRNNPWPDQYTTGTYTSTRARRKRGWKYTCRPNADDYDEEEEAESEGSGTPQGARKFVWTEEIKQNFREELEKLVILDYIMRNTDRGLDNWMVRVDYETGEVSIHSKPMSLHAESSSHASASRPSSAEPVARPAPPSHIYKVQEQMNPGSRSTTPSQTNCHASIKIGAIDNSLAFPWKHPDQWRSFPFGWLFLPVSLIGQPFSQKTRDHFIPILTNSKWWAETQSLLRKLFEQDTDFKERMWQKQLAVLKGQAWNVVETLKDPEQGPLELTRRTRVHVWDDEMEVPIAVPLRVPPTSSPRPSGYFDHRPSDHDEVDIGAAIPASAPALNHDLLLLDNPFSPRVGLPSTVRLGGGAENRSKSSPNMAQRNGERAFSPFTDDPREDDENNGNSSSNNNNKADARGANGNRPRMSYNGPNSHSRSSRDWARRKRSGSGRRRSSFGGLWWSDDEADGDLGYSALTAGDGAKRKVIAERLESVKARDPVFTWC